MGLYYENATHQLRNATKTQKNKLYESARKRYRETHDITVRKRTIPSVYTCRPKLSEGKETVIYKL